MAVEESSRWSQHYPARLARRGGCHSSQEQSRWHAEQARAIFFVPQATTLQERVPTATMAQTISDYPHALLRLLI